MAPHWRRFRRENNDKPSQEKKKIQEFEKQKKIEEIEKRNKKIKWVLFHADIYNFEGFFPDSAPLEYEEVVRILYECNNAADKHFDSYKILPVDEVN